MYTTWYIPKNVTSGLPWPANVTGDNLSTKPYLQTIFQTDIAAVNGTVSSVPSATQNPNGDWGAFLNTYYWLASCADALIGNLSTPDAMGTTTPTILGQLAYQANLGNVNLANTVIVFTADHGEYGGAHGLQGKSASSYEEAINIPLFVMIPGLSQINRPRTHMVSHVDLFGMFAAMATNNLPVTGVKQWKQDNPQLTSREDMISFLENNSNVNMERILTSSDSSFNNQAYIMHTTSEYYADTKDSSLNYGNYNYHVVCLRTGNESGSGSSQKLVYYYNWVSGQHGFNSTNLAGPPTPVSGSPSNIVTEHYVLTAGLGSGLTSDPGELNNIPIVAYSGADASFRSAINTQMQAMMGSVNNVNLDTLLSGTARPAWALYIEPPPGLTASPSTVASGPSYQNISISGSNIQAGPTIKQTNEKTERLLSSTFLIQPRRRP